MELQHGLDLKNGPLSWLDTLPSPPTYPQLEEDIVCDVLVIGGGEAGSLCAYHLAEQQVDTVIVDRRRFGFGSTSANTGLLQFANDKELTACINTFGEEKGVRFYKLCQNAVSDIGKLCNKLKIFPDYVPRDSLYYASSIEDVPSLQKEYLALKKHGFPVRYMKEEEIREKYSFSKPAAIFATGDADINPYKFANSLVYSAVDFGLRAYQETEIVSRETEKDHVVLYTKNRKKIKAKKVVFATGYETQIQLQNNANAVLSSTYAIVTQPIEEFTGWSDRCLIWETARPYLYIRTSVDNRIIAGGLDEPMVQAEQRDARLIHKRDLLVQAVQELFPYIPNLRADYYWSATFGGTHDGYPLIGEQPEYPHCYFALGYGGNGTVYSIIAAQIITSLITQGSHHDADLFRFNRAPYQTSTR